MGLFHPATDSVLRLVLGGVASLPVAAIAGLMLLARSPLGTGASEPIQQPIHFDHRHHAADEGIDCRYCHDAVTRAATAGIPPTSRCMGCHAQIWSQSPILAPVRDSLAHDSSIAWNRVHRLPDYVFFNHAIHVNKGVGCVTCHGRVDQMAAVHRVAPLTMEWCLDCHRDPKPHLRSLSTITQMDRWEPPSPSLEVHPRTECTTCHR